MVKPRPQKSSLITIGSLLIALSTVVFSGCASNKAQVMRGENNVITVIGTGADEGKAQEVAIEKANKYCEGEDKQAIFIDQKDDYQGSVPKGTHRTVRKLPGVGNVLTNGDDFKVTMRVTCR